MGEICGPRLLPGLSSIRSAGARLMHTGGPTARLAWAGARARRLWALKAKYTSTGREGTGEGARGTRTSACYLDFVSGPGLSNFLGPLLLMHPGPRYARPGARFRHPASPADAALPAGATLPRRATLICLLLLESQVRAEPPRRT
jgi:hypothetical protein